MSFLYTWGTEGRDKNLCQILIGKERDQNKGLFCLHPQIFRYILGISVHTHTHTNTHTHTHTNTPMYTHMIRSELPEPGPLARDCSLHRPTGRGSRTLTAAHLSVCKHPA